MQREPSDFSGLLHSTLAKIHTEVNGYLMFVEANQAVCCWFGAACQEKKESFSISAFKYLRVATFIWKANIYCTHLREVGNRVCAHVCALIRTCMQSSWRNFNLWECRRVRKRVFTHCQKLAMVLKMNIWSQQPGCAYNTEAKSDWNVYTIIQ